jgi:hypothetical protein
MIQAVTEADWAQGSRRIRHLWTQEDTGYWRRSYFTY